MKYAIACLLLTSTTFAAEVQTRKDISYCEPAGKRHQLDVTAPQTGKDHPVIVWIHGGGWARGDKSNVQKKPQVFADRGFVFVSVNYRFLPEVTIQEMTGDIAKAIHWVHDHAREYGGNPEEIIVMGHSAGAHLAALVCTDDSYLKAEGLPLSILKGCVPVDVSVYDIPKRLKDGGALSAKRIKKLFGETEAGWQKLSPALHVEEGKQIPPFLILHVADRKDTRVQSEHFAQVLREAKISATVVAAEGKTHGTINSELGIPDDKPSTAIYEFLDRVTGKK